MGDFKLQDLHSSVKNIKIDKPTIKPEKKVIDWQQLAKEEKAKKQTELEYRIQQRKEMRWHGRQQIRRNALRLAKLTGRILAGLFAAATGIQAVVWLWERFKLL